MPCTVTRASVAADTIGVSRLRVAPSTQTPTTATPTTVSPTTLSPTTLSPTYAVAGACCTHATNSHPDEHVHACMGVHVAGSGGEPRSARACTSVLHRLIGRCGRRVQDRCSKHADSDHCDADDAQPDDALADVRHRAVTAHRATVSDMFPHAHVVHSAGDLGGQSLG